jgi:two-component system alkaline phosphatase synthesis response regulator PhoP
MTASSLAGVFCIAGQTIDPIGRNIDEVSHITDYKNGYANWNKKNCINFTHMFAGCFWTDSIYNVVGGNMKKGKILIADDEPDIVNLLRLRLEIDGYEVATALNGEEALVKIQQDKPDLILLDVAMPKLDGFEVCRRLKENNIYKDIPIFILTARTHTKSKEVGKSLGVEEYITKPFNLKTLVAKVEQKLNKKFNNNK